MSTEISSLALSKPAKWPPLSTYGPFRLLEALPWLLLASSLRVAAWSRPNGVGLLLLALADIVLFLAFILVARRMVEIADGTTNLGRLNFVGQVALARAVLVRVVGLLVCVAACLWGVGLPDLAPHFLLGAFDGIAFDQFTKVGMAWSGVLACLVLLMVVRSDREGQPRLFAGLAEFGRRLNFLAPAILAVVTIQYGLSFVQGWARFGVWIYYQNPFAPELMKKGLFFLFVVGFAAIRLWLTLALLTFGLRASYRAATA